ncbi:MAG: Gfo/Idh/MocA family oxidoreductase [Chloroflexi bacterium]|nr:Gfo/Idh/MocA family oxidoreductase [Chloroflexota bacterium]
MARVVQVGLGGMGNTWLRCCTADPNVEYVGLVDINPAIAEQQASRYHLSQNLLFDSLTTALERTHPDGVIIVTPPATHRELSITALEHGAHVLSEKPLADTLAAAADIVRAAQRTGKIHMVAQNYRYRPATQTLKQVITSGQLGEVGSVHVTFFRGPHFGGFREEMPYPLVIDMAIHHFDLLRFIIGGASQRAIGLSWNPSWSWFRGDASVAVAFRFPENIIATYTGSWCSQAGSTSWNGEWRVECTEGVAWLHDDSVSIALQGEGSAQVPIPSIEMPYKDQAYLLREFIQAIQTGALPATPCADNIDSLRMVFDAIEACRLAAT